MRLGELIAIARECKRLTLRDLEKRCGVSNALLSQIETGKVKDPGFRNVVKIAKALNLKLNRLAECE
jgi:transcriptional regulator with XRE-family HTH domain